MASVCSWLGIKVRRHTVWRNASMLVSVSMAAVGSNFGEHPELPENPRKSIWTTVASRLSNSPEDSDRLAENRRRKKSWHSGSKS